MIQALKKNILICERFAVEALVLLKTNENFNVKNYSEADLVTANALVIRSKFKINAELLDKCQQLELIITCTSGYDHIDLKETKKRNITVMYTPDANVTSAAEHTWAMIMASQRQLLNAHKDIKSGQWNRDLFVSNELSGKILGIVGLGRIGLRVAHYANAFSMKILAFDPYQTDEQFTKANATRVGYEEILRQSDVLTFHVPATFETKNMFSKSQIDCVSPEISIVNVSRGAILNEDDLAEALNQNKIKFAALDVFNKEPLGRESKLLKNPRVLLTPHLGAYTEEAFLKASLEGAARLKDFFINQKTLNSLPLINDWGSLSFAERT